MLIKPETSKLWEETLKHFRNIDEMKKVGDTKKAMEEAIHAFMLGQRAVDKLSQELNMPDLKFVASNALQDFFERNFPSEGGKYYTPKEQIEWAQKTLRRLSDELPPDTFPPVR